MVSMPWSIMAPWLHSKHKISPTRPSRWQWSQWAITGLESLSLIVTPCSVCLVDLLITIHTNQTNLKFKFISGSCSHGLHYPLHLTIVRCMRNRLQTKSNGDGLTPKGSTGKVRDMRNHRPPETANPLQGKGLGLRHKQKHKHVLKDM